MKEGAEKRWNKNSEAGKYLRTSLLSGTIDSQAQPKDVRMANPIFQVYSLEQFRQAFLRTKQELKNLLPANKRWKEDKVLDSAPDEDYISDDVKVPARVFNSPAAVSNSNIVLFSNISDERIPEWKPIWNQVPWTDHKSRDRISLFVLLPSGVKENFSFRLVDELNVLELTICWPLEVYDVNSMFAPFAGDYEDPEQQPHTSDMKRKLQDYTVKRLAIQKHMNRLAMMMDSQMQTKHKIKLLDQVTGDTEVVVPCGASGCVQLLVDFVVAPKVHSTVTIGTGLMRSV